MGKRLGRLESVLAEKGFQNAVLTSENDIFYYTGYRPSSGAFLTLKPEPTLFLTGLDNEAESIKGVRKVFMDKPEELLSELNGSGSLAFDETSMSSRAYVKLSGAVKLTPAAPTIKLPRMEKDSGEIRLVREACRISKSVLRNLKASGTEESVSKSVKIAISRAGADEAFPPIVASGKNGYFIHHHPGPCRITSKALTVVDLGARFRGYCSDFTRMFCSSPGTMEKKILESIESIQGSIIDMLSPGVKVSDIQKVHQRLMEKAGYKVWHSFGHGVGLSVHEPLSAELRENMVLTVEPGAYIKGFGGCRIEDTLIIGKKKAKPL